MNTRTQLVLLVLLDVVVVLVLGEQLADSGYPIKGANSLRNNKINRGIVCPNVAPGRTTVLAEVWTSANTYLEIQTPYLDGQGSIYVYDTNTESIMKVNATTGVSGGKYSTSNGAITLGKSGVAYVSPDSSTFVFDWTTMNQIVNPIANEAATTVSTSFVPYKSQYMLRANINDDVVPAVSFLDADQFTWSSTQPKVSPGVTKDIIVFNDSGNDHFIAVGDGYDGIVYHVELKSDLYQVNVTDMSLSYSDDIWPFVSDDILYVVTTDSATHRFHVMNGTEILPPIPAPSSGYFLSRNGIAHNGKYVAMWDGGSMFRLTEMISNHTIHDSFAFSGNPTFSIPDNVLVFPGYLRQDGTMGKIQVVAMDWNDWSIRAIGELPETGSDPQATEVVIGEDCQVSVIVGGVGNGVLHTLEPLPIQDIVPILECIDDNNMAYFSYENRGSRNFRMPFVVDRNNLAPTGKAPTTVFNIGDGPHYPLSAPMNVTSYFNQNVSWYLEDYTLSFTPTPGNADLMCPSTINITLIISSSSTFKIDVIGQAVRDAFVAVTKITPERVSLLRVSSPKRSVVQTNELEVELQVAAGNSTSDPSSAEVVQQFVQSQQPDFNTELSNTPGAPPDATITSIATKQPSTSVRGTPNAVSEPVTAPVNSPQQPASNPPSSIPTTISRSNIRIVDINIMILLLLFIMSAL